MTKTRVVSLVKVSHELVQLANTIHRTICRGPPLPLSSQWCAYAPGLIHGHTGSLMILEYKSVTQVHCLEVSVIPLTCDEWSSFSSSVRIPTCFREPIHTNCIFGTDNVRAKFTKRFALKCIIIFEHWTRNVRLARYLHDTLHCIVLDACLFSASNNVGQKRQGCLQAVCIHWNIR